MWDKTQISAATHCCSALCNGVTAVQGLNNPRLATGGNSWVGGGDVNVAEEGTGRNPDMIMCCLSGFVVCFLI